MERCHEGRKILVAINADACEFTAFFNSGVSNATDLITGDSKNIDNGLTMPPYSVQILKQI